MYVQGLKVGILRLLMNGYSVKYATGPSFWKFLLKKARGNPAMSLHFKVSISKARNKSGDTTVLVGGGIVDHLKAPSKKVDFDLLGMQRFLFLHQDLKNVRTEGGELLLCLPELEAKKEFASCFADSGSSPMYIQGMFVRHVRRLRMAVNLFDVNITRDRTAVMDDSDLELRFEEIWSEALVGKTDLCSQLRDRFIAYAQDTLGSVEQDLIYLMDGDVADAIYAHLEETVEDVFPIEKGDAAGIDIVLRLKKKPFECRRRLLDLLLKSEAVHTVEEAQRKAFINACESNEKVRTDPLANALAAYVRQVGISRQGNADIKVVVSLCFRAENVSGIDGFLEDNKLYISEKLITEPDCNASCPSKVSASVKRFCSCALIALVSMAERELSKGRGDLDRQGMAFLTKMFLAENATGNYSDEMRKPQLELDDHASETAATALLCQPKVEGLPPPRRYITRLRKHDGQAGKGDDSLQSSLSRAKIEGSALGESIVDISEKIVDVEGFNYRFQRHKFDRLETTNVYSFSVTAIFEKEYASDKHKEVTEESQRFLSAPAAPCITWSEEQSEVARRFDVSFAPIPPSCQMELELQGTANGLKAVATKRLNSEHVLQSSASFEPRELFGADYEDTMSLQGRARLVPSSISLFHLTRSDWGSCTSLRSLRSLSVEIKRRREEESGHDLEEVFDNDSADDGDRGFGDGVENESDIASAAHADTSERPLKKPRVALPRAGYNVTAKADATPDSSKKLLDGTAPVVDAAALQAQSEKESRKKSHISTKPTTTPPLVNGGKAVPPLKGNVTTPSSPRVLTSEAQVLESRNITEELKFVPEFRKPVEQRAVRRYFVTRKAARKVISTNSARKSVPTKGTAQKPQRVGVECNTEQLNLPRRVVSLSDERAVAAETRRAETGDCRGSVSSSLVVPNGNVISGTTDADDIPLRCALEEPRRTSQNIQGHLGPRGWPANSMYTDALEIESQNVEALPLLLRQKLLYRKHVETRVIENANHPCFRGMGVFATDTIPEGTVVFN